MIITNAGQVGINSSDQVNINQVIFSDLELSNIAASELQQLTSVAGQNTVTLVPTVALLANGHALVQADAKASFSVHAIFIFAQGNGNQFLLAVDNTDGNYSAEINMDAIKKLSFNAIANDLVMTSDVDSLVASAYIAMPKSDDAPSYASDAYNNAVAYANSILSSDSNVASSYANQAYTSANSYTDSQVTIINSEQSSAINATNTTVNNLGNSASSALSSVASSTANNYGTIQKQLTSKVNFNSLDSTILEQKIIGANDDLNNITTSGTYWCNFFVPINSPKEFTTGVYPRFKLTVTSPTSGIAYQAIYLIDGGGTQGLPNFYVRSTYEGGIWNPWQTMANTDMLQANLNSLQSGVNSNAANISNKADANVLSNYVTQTQLNITAASNSSIVDQLASSFVNNMAQIQGQFSGVSSLAVIASSAASSAAQVAYDATQSNAYRIYLREVHDSNIDKQVTGIDGLMSSKANITDLSSYATSDNVNSLFSSTNTAISNISNFTSQQLSEKANKTDIDATNYDVGTINASSDLNNITTPGTYWCNFFIPTHSPKEFVEGVYPRFKLTVTSPMNGIAHQTIYLMDGAGTQGLPTFYVRSTYENNVWNSWQAMANTDMLQADLAALQSAVNTNINPASLTSALANKADISTLSSYVTNDNANATTSSFNSAIANKADASLLADYVTQSELSSAAQSNNADTKQLTSSVVGNMAQIQNQFSSTASLAVVASSVASGAISSANLGIFSNAYRIFLAEAVNSSQSSAIASLENIDNSLNIDQYAKTSDVATLSNSINNELSSYATDASINAELSNYATNSSVNNELSNYATNANISTLSSTVESSLANKADVTILSSYVTQQQLSDNDSNITSTTTSLTNSVAGNLNVMESQFASATTLLAGLQKQIDQIVAAQLTISTNIGDITALYDVKSKVIALYGKTNMANYNDQLTLDLTNLFTFYKNRGMNTISLSSSWLNFQPITAAIQSESIVINGNTNINFSGCTFQLAVN